MTQKAATKEDKQIVGASEQKQDDKAKSLAPSTATEAQIQACKMVAEYMGEAEIVRALLPAIQRGEFSPAWVHNIAYPSSRARCWQPLIDHFRRLYRQEIPICDPAWRARTRQRISQRVEEDKPDIALQALRDEDRAESRRSGAEQVGGQATVNVIFGDLHEQSPQNVVDAEVVTALDVPNGVDGLLGTSEQDANVAPADSQNDSQDAPGEQIGHEADTEAANQ
jgi:hypothetical protein